LTGTDEHFNGETSGLVVVVPLAMTPPDANVIGMGAARGTGVPNGWHGIKGTLAGIDGVARVLVATGCTLIVVWVAGVTPFEVTTGVATRACAVRAP